MDEDALVGLAAHEAFHVFQAASRVEGRRFGAGENSMLVARYPVFDAENEAGMALEGLLLREALTMPGRDAAVRAARAFLAVRAARQRRLGAEFARFEDAAEMNEGLADYARHRAVRANASIVLAPGLAEVASGPVRLRFYATGAAMAHLLDRLGGAEWKQRMMRDDLTLGEALARAAGRATDEAAEVSAVEARLNMAALRARAAEKVAELRASRTVRADSVLAAPGLRVQVVPDRLGGPLNPCGFDPQNLLRVDDARWLHTRWLRACTEGVDVEFNTPVVQDEAGGSLAAVAGPEGEVRITAGGRTLALADGARVDGVADLRIESAPVTLRARLADVERTGRTIIIHPRRVP
ncbi:MAG TPA: hypothetical protein VF665_16765 [Longimicrobium sp.]|jgi:hypothetical protein|uniref:hypothetical protein n=1 Tax=Longimicrobium sp. TaxID=2029185 RepID=UPI002ED83D97